MNQLEIWRIQAFHRLTILISQMQGELNPNDGLIDSLVRSLSALPVRPADKLPYASIFGTTDVENGREKAAERLQELSEKIKGNLNPQDSLVDQLIRSLSGLPDRPADKQPYASLFSASKMIVLTPKLLQAIAPEANRDRVNQLTPYLNRTMVEFDIDTPLRQAHFLAQIAHESDRFNALEEYGSGEDYEGRSDLGNVSSGDGVRFKGRGLIQITGRTNYKHCGRALGIDLINHPNRLAEPELACRSAGWFWSTHELNRDADRDDAETITRIINGGYNGLDDRMRLLASAQRVLNMS
jgi:putative chitinase